MKPSAALAVLLAGFAMMPVSAAPLPASEELLDGTRRDAVGDHSSPTAVAIDTSATEEETMSGRDVMFNEPRAKLKNNTLAHARDESNAGVPTFASDDLD
ncbi:hypothetical protein BD626DRAFT_563784 [Schizophyllum amplum]|uniref:Uncharacterized protein n=1 Tax=Schizophyllum amplum TaxID=97359 RepID=A0A550CZ90_9AGAR|nr:hypothetical protein BD626DRAFT_563784 [Auriculariopsis ampla]